MHFLSEQPSVEAGSALRKLLQKYRPYPEVATAALLRVMPDSKAKAMSPADLFQAAVIPSRTTGNRALRELLSAGRIPAHRESEKWAFLPGRHPARGGSEIHVPAVLSRA